MGRNAHFDVGDLDHRHRHAAAAAISEPQHAVSRVERLLDLASSSSRSTSSVISTSISFGSG